MTTENKSTGCSGCRRSRNKNIIVQPKSEPFIIVNESAPIPAKKETLPEPVKQKTMQDYNRDGKDFTKLYIESDLGRVSVAKMMIELESWLRMPYEHLGRSRHGIDCIGLVLLVYKNLGLIPKDFETEQYQRQWYLEHEMDIHPAFDKLKKVMTIETIHNKEDFLPGDCVVFSFGKAKEAHVGILTTRNTVIHSVAGIADKGRVIESRVFEDNTWKDKIQYSYRLVKGLK